MITIVLIILLLCACVDCASQSRDAHLEQAIHAINNGNYVLADQEIPLVQHWGCEEDHVFRINNIEHAYSYLQHCQSISLSVDNKDSIALYLVDECGSKLNDYLSVGDRDGAEQICLLGLKMCKISSVKHHQDYALLFVFLSQIAQQKGNISQAIEYAKRAKQVFNDNHLPENENYCSLLIMTANQYIAIKDLVNAYPYMKKAYEVCLRLGGPELTYYNSVSRTYEKLEGNIAEYYLGKNEYNESLIHYLNGLQLHETLQGKDAGYAVLLNNIGQVYEKTGDYENAEKYSYQALRINRDYFGVHSAEYANSLNNVASLSKVLGDFEKAKDQYEQALSIFKSIYGEKHEKTSVVLNNLGLVYSNLKDFKKAEQYLLKSLKIFQSVKGKDASECESPLDNLGSLYLLKKDYHSSYSYYGQSLAIKQKIYGEVSPQVASTYNNIGMVWMLSEDYDKSAECFEKACSVNRNLLGENHPETITNMVNLGDAYFAKGDFEKAASYWLKGYEFRKQQFLQSLDFMTERERENYLRTMRSNFEYTVPNLVYECYAKNPSYAGIAYDNALFYKGLLLQSTEAIKRSILESGDDALIRQWSELVAIKKRKDEPYDEQEEHLEKQLIQQSAAYRNAHQLWDARWGNVRASLQDNQVAVEFMHVLRNNSDIIYCALVLRKEFDYPQFVPLFESDEVLEMMQNASPQELYSYSHYGHKLYDLVWSKITKYIRTGDTIYFSAAGILHQLALESLPIKRDIPISSKYTMIRLSSTRELIVSQSDKSSVSASLFGGIKYDTGIDELSILSKTTTTRSRANYLPSSKQEVDEIYAILKPHLLSAIKHSADSANEESFKALSGAHRNIIHVATHGFYWQDTLARRERYFKQRLVSMNLSFRSEEIDPMDRCGLLFSGANTALSGHSDRLPEGVEDGILTAKEISTMDLRDADLVVLSACETGLGDISGEGVFGLQRAFKMAGVRSILMALWKVDDKATQILMTSFYRLYTEGKTKREALRLAQQEVRKSGYTDPYYWAGFVLLD